MTEVTASPLCWPPGWRRSKSRASAKFGKSVSVKNAYSEGYHTAKRELSIEDGTRRILDELDRMGIASHKVIISSDLRLRNDGLPYSNPCLSG